MKIEALLNYILQEKHRGLEIKKSDFSTGRMVSCGRRSWFPHTPVILYAWTPQTDYICIDVSSLIKRRQKVIEEWWYFFVLINQATWKTSKWLLKFMASGKLTKNKVEVAESCRILKISLWYSECIWKLFSAEHEQCSIQSNYFSDQS